SCRRSSSSRRSRRASTSAVARPRCRARGRRGCRVEDDASPLDLSASLGVGLNIERRRDQIDTFAHPHRATMSPEERARAGVLLQQSPHGQATASVFFPLVQLLACFLVRTTDFWPFVGTKFAIEHSL